MNKRDQKPFPLRMSDDVRGYLEESAKANGRSLNSEIVARLKRDADLDAELTELKKMLFLVQRMAEKMEVEVSHNERLYTQRQVEEAIKETLSKLKSP